MSVKIQLDSSAIEALFPEGTEARVELRRVVIAALVEKLSLKDFKHLDGAMRANIEKATKAAFDQAGVGQRNWNNALVISSDVAADLRAKAKKLVDDEIADSIRAAVSEAAKTYRDSVHEQVQSSLDRVLATGVDGRVKTLVREALSSALS